MKLDKDYTFIYVCPDSGEQLSRHEVFHSDAVCPRCGHVDTGGITHYDQVSGRWRRPSWIERLKGQKAEFFRKDEEDAVMDALKGEHLPKTEDPADPEELIRMKRKELERIVRAVDKGLEDDYDDFGFK